MSDLYTTAYRELLDQYTNRLEAEVVDAIVDRLFPANLNLPGLPYDAATPDLSDIREIVQRHLIAFSGPMAPGREALREKAAHILNAELLERCTPRKKVIRSEPTYIGH